MFVVCIDNWFMIFIVLGSSFEVIIEEMVLLVCFMLWYLVSIVWNVLGFGRSCKVIFRVMLNNFLFFIKNLVKLGLICLIFGLLMFMILFV